MAYVLFYLIIKPLSWLPLWFTYRISDLGFWLLYRVFGYRKEVVVDNMRRSFPDWSKGELEKNAADFYRFFCDSIVESIRLFSMPEAETIRRCRVTNPEILVPHASSERSIIIMGAHYANWEVAALSFYRQLLPHVTMGIYSPLKNETMDRLILGNRTRYGTRLVSRRVVQAYFENPPPGLSADFFIADQSPSNAEWRKLHWTTFLHQTTGFLMGPERYAVRYDRPVYYMRLRSVSRGQYEATLVPVTDRPEETERGFITQAFVRLLEKEIRRAPAYWLWTHRRWKRGVPEEVPALLAGRSYLTGEYER